MKFFVDDTCIGCGVCNATCPDVFEMTDQGQAKATDEEVAEELEADAEEAMNSCPVGAIHKE
jgi:ferredoxin